MLVLLLLRCFQNFSFLANTNTRALAKNFVNCLAKDLLKRKIYPCKTLYCECVPCKFVIRVF